MSLRGRLLIALMGLMLCGLLVADAATYVALQHFLMDQVDQRLADAGEQVEHSSDFHRGGRGGGVPRDFDQARVAASGFYVQTRDESGTVTATFSAARFGQAEGDPALPAVLPTPPHQSAPGQGSPGQASPGQGAANTDSDDLDRSAVYLVVGSTTEGGPDYRVRITSAPGDEGTVIVALPLDDMQLTLNRLLAIELVVTLGVVAVSAGVGMWLVRVGLRPLDDISATAAEIAAGDLTKRVELADDRTEVGKLGTSLNEMLGQIEHAFDEQQRSEEALRKSEERLRRFVADASHELRTPLAAVQAYAELFDRGAEEHPEDLPRMMHNIQKETARMAVLVDDLLLLTRLDQRRPLAQDPVDLGAIGADAVEAARAVEPDRPVQLTVEGSVEVRGDRVRLRQIVDNLLTNVRVHTPAGTPVEVVVEREEAFGVVRVIDHGPGLDDEQAARVFERFYRADPGRSRADGGSGLGLSIVAAIAEAHRGGARVIPTIGGGATFEVAIPLLEADAPAPADPDSSAAAAPKTTSVAGAAGTAGGAQAAATPSRS